MATHDHDYDRSGWRHNAREASIALSLAVIAGLIIFVVAISLHPLPRFLSDEGAKAPSMSAEPSPRTIPSQ